MIETFFQMLRRRLQQMVSSGPPFSGIWNHYHPAAALPFLVIEIHKFQPGSNLKAQGRIEGSVIAWCAIDQLIPALQAKDALIRSIEGAKISMNSAQQASMKTLSSGIEIDEEKKCRKVIVKFLAFLTPTGGYIK